MYRNNVSCEGDGNDRCDFGSSPGQVVSEYGEENEIHNRQRNEEMELLEMGRQLYKMFRFCSNGRVVDLEQVDRWIADNGLNSTNVLEMMREQLEAKSSPGYHTQPWDIEGREDYRAPTVSYAEQDVETKTNLDEISPRPQAIQQGIHAFERQGPYEMVEGFAQRVHLWSLKLSCVDGGERDDITIDLMCTNAREELRAGLGASHHYSYFEDVVWELQRLEIETGILVPESKTLSDGSKVAVYQTSNEWLTRSKENETQQGRILETEKLVEEAVSSKDSGNSTAQSIPSTEREVEKETDMTFNNLELEDTVEASAEPGVLDIDWSKSMELEGSEHELDTLIEDELENLIFQTAEELLADFAERVIAWGTNLVLNEADTEYTRIQALWLRTTDQIYLQLPRDRNWSHMQDLVKDMQVVEGQINERLQESVEGNELVETESAASSAVLETEEPKNTDQWDERNQRGCTENILGDSKESEMNYLALPTSEKTIKTYTFPHSDERVDEVITLCTQKCPLLKVVAATDGDELNCENLASRIGTQEDYPDNHMTAGPSKEKGTNVKERKASRGCRKRFRVCHQKNGRSSARQRYWSLPQNKKRNSDSTIGNCQLLRCSASAILQQTLLILTKLMEIVFPTAAWNEERQSSANFMSDAEQDKAREVPDELNADNKESLSEEALHSDLSDDTASAEGELNEGKTTELVQSNLQLSPRLQTNKRPNEGPQHSQEHADLGPPTPDCEESYSTDWERPPSSPVLIDERQGSQNLEDAHPQGTHFTVRELIDVNTANEQLAVEHLSAHLSTGTDYKIEFKSQLHAADHWREAIGLEAPVVANSQEMFSCSTTELDPASSGCQKETPYQEELKTQQNPTGPHQSRRANLAAQEAGATDNQNFLPAGGWEQNHTKPQMESTRTCTPAKFWSTSGREKHVYQPMGNNEGNPVRV